VSLVVWADKINKIQAIGRAGYRKLENISWDPTNIELRVRIRGQSPFPLLEAGFACSGREKRSDPRYSQARN
jgi:hypothetical protein